MKFSLFSKSTKAVLCESVSGLPAQSPAMVCNVSTFKPRSRNDAAHYIDTSRIEQRRSPEFVRGGAKQHRNYGRAADQDPTPQDSTAVV